MIRFGASGICTPCELGDTPRPSGMCAQATERESIARKTRKISSSPRRLDVLKSPPPPPITRHPRKTKGKRESKIPKGIYQT